MTPAARPAAAYAAFVAFGALWGAWGASLPAVRDQAGVTDAELGTALLFVGAGALPTMALVGRVVDRHPVRTPAVLLVVMAATGLARGRRGAGARCRWRSGSACSARPPAPRTSPSTPWPRAASTRTPGRW